VGFAFFATLFFISRKWKVPLIQTDTPEWSPDILPPIAVLLALLILAEGFLISRSGSKGTSPKLIIGKRGLVVGIHEVKRLWMLPVFLVIPGESLSAPFSWWPLFSIGEQSYALILVPFAIGFSQHIKGMLPSESVKNVGKKVIQLGGLLVSARFNCDCGAGDYRPGNHFFSTEGKRGQPSVLFLKEKSRSYDSWCSA